MRKPLTPKQIFDEIEKRKKIRRKKLEDKILSVIDTHLKTEMDSKEDIIFVLSDFINRLTK